MGVLDLAAEFTNIIHSCLTGGIAHQDTFDPKPQSPTEYRGTLEVIDTRLPGVQFSSLLPRTATILDRMTLCRGVSHVLADHDAEEFNAIAKSGGSFEMERRVLYKRTIAYAAMISCRAVDRAVQILGAQGVFEDSIEQRAFRDIHAMNAHIAVQWDINAVGYAEQALGLEISDKRL